jgi:FixJ family two-component response regulator
MVQTHTIAVVDDDPSVRTALRQLLRSAGFAAMTFASAEEFLVGDACAAVDFVVADVTLPGISGVALVQEIAKARASLPALLITAADDAATAELLRHVGAVPQLRKPFSEDAFFDVISRALRADT